MDVYVPELGFTLNNRAGGFTDGGERSRRLEKRPVHTLAPALVTTSQGGVSFGHAGRRWSGADAVAGSRRNPPGAVGLGAGNRAATAGVARTVRCSSSRVTRASRAWRRGATGSRRLRDGDARFGAVVCAGWIDDHPVRRGGLAARDDGGRGSDVALGAGRSRMQVRIDEAWELSVFGNNLIQMRSNAGNIRAFANHAEPRNERAICGPLESFSPEVGADTLGVARRGT